MKFKQHSSHMRPDARTELENMLAHILQKPDIVGAIVMQYDGTLIATLTPDHLDLDSIIDTALQVFATSNGTQVVTETLTIADFGSGLLVVVRSTNPLNFAPDRAEA